MMEPPPSSRICGTKALAAFHNPFTFTAIAASQLSSVSLSKRPPPRVP